MTWTKKEWGLVGATAILLLVALNLASFFVIKRQLGVSIYDSKLYEAKKNQFKKDVGKGSIPHPFYGLSALGWRSWQNQLTPEPLFDRISESKTPKPIKVLVLGGSVAANMSNRGLGHDEYMLATLLNSYFKTDRFVVFSAAFDGGKQPQQYFRYQYLDLLGFRPDIVINLDGFNEIALPISENQPLGNPAIFPRVYSRLLHASTSNRSCAELSNDLLDSDTRLPLTEFLIWIYVWHCHRNIEGALNAVPWWSSATGVEASTNYLTESIEIWEQSSNKLNEALTARGIDYIHILQPNQYLEGSKNFSDEEKEKYLSYEPYGKPIRDHYGKLSKDKLTVRNFRDQRFLFKNTEKTVYGDSCCHFNQVGMEMIINDLISSSEALFRKHLTKN
jgi:hypothetical protein